MQKNTHSRGLNCPKWHFRDVLLPDYGMNSIRRLPRRTWSIRAGHPLQRPASGELNVLQTFAPCSLRDAFRFYVTHPTAAPPSV